MILSRNFNLKTKFTLLIYVLGHGFSERFVDDRNEWCSVEVRGWGFASYRKTGELSTSADKSSHWGLLAKDLA